MPRKKSDRTTVIIVRVSPDEKRLMQERAKSLSVTVSEMIRWVACVER
jgi:hypothetical protein